jgi:hypothetical protein
VPSWGRVRGGTAVNGGSKLLIFVLRAANGHDLSLSFRRVEASLA